MKLKSELTPRMKNEMLLNAVHLAILTGNPAHPFVGKPLEYYDFENVFDLIVKYDNENSHPMIGFESIFEFGVVYAD
jgi:hypothetical protein